MLGTGVVKGPLNMYKRVHNWQRNDRGEREYSPFEKVVPRLEHVPLWDFHPDPSATGASPTPIALPSVLAPLLSSGC